MSKQTKLSNSSVLKGWVRSRISGLFIDGTSYRQAAKLAQVVLNMPRAESAIRKAVSEIAKDFRSKHCRGEEGYESAYFLWNGHAKDLSKTRALLSLEWEQMRLKLSHYRDRKNPAEIARLLDNQLDFPYGVENVREMMRLMKFDIEEAA